MTAELAIQRVVCRGNEQTPAAWEVWGTSRHCRSVDVRFVFPSLEGRPEFQLGNTVTVIHPRNVERRFDVQCQRDAPDLVPASGEDLWVARFYSYEHAKLARDWPWLMDAADRRFEIEATATVEPPEPALDPIRRSFTRADVLSGYVFEAGVLLVHGIGRHPQGETLFHFSEPVISFLQRWLRGVSDEWRGAYSKEEAEQWQNLVFSSTLRNQQDLFDLTDEVGRFVKREPRKGPAVDKASREQQMARRFSQFLVGDVCVSDTAFRPLASAPDVAGSTSLRLSAVDRNGALQQTHVLLKEAWWTEEVALPTTAQLRTWISAALPQVVATWVAAATHITLKPAVAGAGGRPDTGEDAPLTRRGRFVRWIDRWVTRYLLTSLALVFCVGVQFSLYVLAAVSRLPFQWVKALVNPLIALLMGTTGQSYAMVTSDLRRSAIVSNVRRHLNALCDWSKSVIVLAHSQGAEVSRHVVASRRRPEVKSCTSFGSGVKLLGVLSREDQAPNYVRCARRAQLVLVAGGLAAFVVSGHGVPWWIVPATVLFSLAVVGRDFATPPAYDQTFRASVPLTDYYASRDPVPCGKLSENRAQLDAIDFKLIEVHNTGSVILDHTSYFENIEEFVAPVAFHIAALAGCPVAKIRVDDASRLERAQGRRRALVEGRQFIARLAMLMLPAAAALSIAASRVPWREAAHRVMSAWPGLSAHAWLLVTERTPALSWAALPVFVVMAICVVERKLLNRQLADNVDALVMRREPADRRSYVAVRLVTYLAAAVSLVGWIAIR